MSKWFDSKEDLIDELQSVAYQLDSASDGGDTLENVRLEKSHTAVVLDNAGSIEVKLDPPEE